jgi:hypothetical protein
VVSESYDEVVFTDPSETFFSQLQRLTTNPLPPVEYAQREHFGSFSDHDICAALIEAQKFLNAELDSVKKRLVSMDAEMLQVDTALREQARNSRAAAATAAAASAAAAVQQRSSGAAGSSKNPAGAASSSLASTVRTSNVATTAANKSQPTSKKLKAST